MTTALLRSTQVTVTVVVQVSSDREAELLTVLFILLTPFLILWRMKQKIDRLRDELVLWIEDITDLLIFISKVIAITFNAFAFGLGIKP